MPGAPGGSTLSSEVKVTDKRMFTPDGELREEFRFIEERPSSRETPAAGDEPGEPRNGGPGAQQPAVSTGSQGAASREPEEAPPDRPGAREASGPPLELPLAGSVPGAGPGFFDLIGTLAEPASKFLSAAASSNEERTSYLELARLYIELLDVLRGKTLGNLTAQESAALEDALYQLRVAYVEVSG